MNGKLIIFSAPSGSGKTTLVNRLLNKKIGLEFSISATSRKPRGTEQNGHEYYFLSVEEFKEKIEKKEFVEYEEVYPGCYYGTLRSEIERISAKGNNAVFDIDVKGGINLKNQFGEQALSIFVAPPSVETLRQRLINRGTDSEEMIEKRVGKAQYEMSFASQFDIVIVNDILEIAEKETEKAIRNFISKK
ncbi:MAG: guanylate kinase [Bacteroidetes bacterium]|nr:guanylate kinase [Bacteroidota bacterium]